MKKMTNQLLEMERLDMSKLPMRPERINLSDVLTESILSFEIPLNQKGLRNEDSIEMMDYIRDSLYFDASMAYGWTESLSSGICKMVVSGDGAVASTVAGQKTAVETKIKTMMDDVSK